MVPQAVSEVSQAEMCIFIPLLSWGRTKEQQGRSLEALVPDVF